MKSWSNSVIVVENFMRYLSQSSPSAVENTNLTFMGVSAGIRTFLTRLSTCLILLPSLPGRINSNLASLNPHRHSSPPPTTGSAVSIPVTLKTVLLVGPKKATPLLALMSMDQISVRQLIWQEHTWMKRLRLSKLRSRKVSCLLFL